MALTTDALKEQISQEDNRSLQEKLIEMYGSLDNVPQANFTQQPGGFNPQASTGQEGLTARPAFDQYGQPSMHTPGMQQIEVPNSNYGIDPANQNPTNPQMGPGSGMPAGPNGSTIQPSSTSGPLNPFGLPDYQNQYQGDSPFGDIFNDFYGSGASSNMQTADMAYNPFTGKHGSSSQRGDMYDFISGAYGGMQDRMQQRDVKSPEFMDKFNMYGDAMNTYNDWLSEQEKYQSQNPLQPGMPGGIANLPPPGSEPPSLGPFDPNFVPSSPFDPVTSGGQEQIYSAGTGINTAALPYLNLDRPNPNFIPGTSPFDPVTSGGQESSTGTAPNTTNIFGAGNNPIMNNPIAPIPSMPQQPSMDMGNFTSDLMGGIGNLFEQYFPNQGQNTQSRLGQSNLSNNFGQASSFNGPGILGLITPQRG